MLSSFSVRLRSVFIFSVMRPGSPRPIRWFTLPTSCEDYSDIPPLMPVTQVDDDDVSDTVLLEEADPSHGNYSHKDLLPRGDKEDTERHSAQD